VLLLDRLRALAERRRWLIGLAAGARCRQLTAALVAIEGGGLASRVEVVAHRRARLPPQIAKALHRLRTPRAGLPADAALFAARLAECQAALVDEFATDIAVVWERVSALAIDGPGLWRRAGGLTGCAGLGDAARIADLTGLNVIDAFPARDLAQDGRGRPLLPIPFWMLLHASHTTRVLVDMGRSIHLTYLPASRDASGASRVLGLKVPCDGRGSADSVAQSVVQSIAERMPQSPSIEELVLCGGRSRDPQLAEALAGRLPRVRVLSIGELGIAEEALKAAGVALLGLLHLDHVPANATALTGARTGRILGRLTPGSVVNWHRLVRDMAARRPTVVTLRSAV
jgi:1,6-anhydro-N-acetylmuramate kinase